MKRNNIVQRLISEGFRPETLVKMGDKQLNILSTTVLSEQLDDMVHVSKTDPNKEKITKDLKLKGKSFEVSEEENTQTGQPNEVTTIGYGKSMDINVAKQMAISDAQRQGLGGNGFANITNLRVIKEKKQKNEDGSYYYAVQCTMTVNKPNASREQNNVNEWVEGLVKENYHMVVTKGDITSMVKEKLTESQNPFEKMTLPEDTDECVYADGISKDQLLAQKIANSNARNKFKGKFPEQISLKNIETAHRTPDGHYRYVVGLKVRNEAGAQGEVDEPFVKDNKGELQEQPTMVRKPKVTSNALPEWMKFDSIKSSQPDIATPKTKPGIITKPGERVKPRTPYQPGKGVNPNPKAKY